MKLKGKFAYMVERIFSLQKTWVLFWIIILVASLWRLTNLSLVEFKGDESLNLFLATRPLFGHPFPPASLASSVGILNFPLLNYFLFPITLISYYPPFVSGFIALLNVLALGAYFLILSKYFNRLTAFITTLLFALAPWAILYSRKIWAQDFLIPLVVALLFCFFQIYKEKKQLYWIFFGIISLFLMQIHQTAGILPVLLLFPLLKKDYLHIPFLLLGILIGVLPTLPYIWYEFSHACPDCIAFTGLHARLQTYHPDIFLRIFQITTTSSFHTILGNADNLMLTTMYPYLALLMKFSYAIYIILPGSIAFFWKKHQEYRLFVTTTIIILFIFLFLKIQPEMHYVIILLPFLFLFMGSFIASLLLQKNLLLKITALGVCLLFIITYTSFDYSFFHLLSIKKGFGGDYGETYAIAEKSATTALRSLENITSYKEMVLAYYVPKESIRGATPVGQILYPLSETKRNLPTLNSQMQKTSIDPRVLNQLIAYYTYPQNLTHENLFFLEKQSKTFPVYATIYDLALSDYLYTNHKHYYHDAYFWIEYPEHWNQNRIDNGIVFSDGQVSFTLFYVPQLLPQPKDESWTVTSVKIANQSVNKYRCMKDTTWCGEIVPSLSLGEKTFSISLSPVKAKLDTKTLNFGRKVLEDILDSMVITVY